MSTDLTMGLTAEPRRDRKSRTVADHGDVRRYQHGCRCRPCTTAATAAAKKRKYLRETGRGSMVPSDKVIARIWRLRAAGLSDAEIQTAAKIGPAHLYQIVNRTASVHHSTANRILAVPVPAPSGQPSGNGARVPALGTRRRLRALSAEGWPGKALDKHLATGDGYTSYLLRSEGSTVRLFTADGVRLMCDQLRGLRPEEHGVLPSVAAQTRARAEAKGWAGLAYWDDDDFDNPDFRPATSDEGLSFIQLGRRRHEEIAHLASFGVPEAEIADRLGMTPKYVHDTLRNMRKSAVAA
ncbi:hypothetical protein [Streptomyces ehimensis]|uniref:Uncharacterized protein n=1 Tax=Streptomyces ehimensis TaxID=68195 RepID=A0ABV9BEY8_9ACTN